MASQLEIPPVIIGRMRKRRKAVGERGSWFARIGGASYPCVYEHYWIPGNPPRYRDPEIVQGDRKSDEYIAALKEIKQAILTADTVTEGGSFQRTGYIAQYGIDNITVTGRGLEFDFTRRIEELE